MSKLETITEMIVNEMERFEKNVGTMQNLLDKIVSTKVEFNLRPMEEKLKEFERFVASEQWKREEFLKKFQKQESYDRLRNSIYLGMVIFAIVAALLAYGTANNITTTYKEGREQGIQDYQRYMESFFDENPKAREVYEGWEMEGSK